MDIKQITNKKNTGESLEAAEIAYAVLSYTKGGVSEEDMTAWLRAVFAKGMDFSETLALTHAFVSSGETADLSGIIGYKADKHSTGGVGDKTTLVVAPLAAACGLKIAKMSGRALGHTGGTLDKLESIPGVRTDLDRQAFIDQVNKIGLAVTGQTDSMVPADKMIYALRDKTKTVASLPLIAASVMSKKIAAGADYIVLDVKTGNGAFMKTPPDARELADICVKLGEAAGRAVSAVVSDMNQPLGKAVGGVLEVREAINVLKGRGPEDVKTLSYAIVEMMLLKSGYAGTAEQAASMMDEAVRTGTALDKLALLVAAQGGNEAYIREPARLPAPVTFAEARAPEAGYIRAFETENVGWLARRSLGISLEKKVGDPVAKGDTLAYVFGRDATEAEGLAAGLTLMIEIGPEESTPRPLIYETVNAP